MFYCLVSLLPTLLFVRRRLQRWTHQSCSQSICHKSFAWKGLNCIQPRPAFVRGWLGALERPSCQPLIASPPARGQKIGYAARLLRLYLASPLSLSGIPSHCFVALPLAPIPQQKKMFGGFPLPTLAYPVLGMVRLPGSSTASSAGGRALLAALRSWLHHPPPRPPLPCPGLHRPLHRRLLHLPPPLH